MTNAYYTPSGNPGTGASGASAPMRSEFVALQAAFDKLPVFGGHANEFVVVNGSGNGLTTIPGLTFTMNAFSVGIVATGNVSLNAPASSGTLALLTDVTTGAAAAAAAAQAAAILASAPPGTVHLYSGTALPVGYIHAAGQAVSRTGITAALFAACGVIYGVGDGTTTFNVVDLRGRVPAGVDNPGGLGTAGRLTATTIAPNGTTLGGVGGGQLNSTSVSVSVGVSGATGGSLLVSTVSFAMDGDNADLNVQGGSGSIVANAGHAHANVQANGATSGALAVSATGGGSGGSANFSVVQPAILLYYIIKT